MASERTRTELVIWGKGSTPGEYLAADILRLENFVLIDPVHPQGGPDGKKDIICYRDQVKFVVACWFPNNSGKESYTSLFDKFDNDISGVSANNAKGFVFVTNCSVSDGERSDLIKHAQGKGCQVCEIYHLERLRQILDTPLGFGTRLRVFDIEMTKEDQLSFYEAVKNEHLRLIMQSLQKFEANVITALKDTKQDLIEEMKRTMQTAMSSALKSGETFQPSDDSSDGVTNE